MTIKDLIDSLNNLNILFKGISDSIKNLEQNELESYKNNTEMKYSLIKEIGEVNNSFRQFESTFSEAMLKMNFSDANINRNLQEIKDLIKKTESEIGLPDCKECKVLETSNKALETSKEVNKEKEKWNKRLWGVVIFLGLTVLTLLGLNIANIVKLSGVLAR